MAQQGIQIKTCIIKQLVRLGVWSDWNQYLGRKFWPDFLTRSSVAKKLCDFLVSFWIIMYPLNKNPGKIKTDRNQDQDECTCHNLLKLCAMSHFTANFNPFSLMWLLLYSEPPAALGGAGKAGLHTHTPDIHQGHQQTMGEKYHHLYIPVKCSPQ